MRETGEIFFGQEGGGGGGGLDVFQCFLLGWPFGCSDGGGGGQPLLWWEFSAGGVGGWAA